MAVLLVAAAAAVHVPAADAPAPSAALGKPATGVRVGGSPADAAFRAAQQKTGADYRTARAACRRGPAGANRTNCLKLARQRLEEQRLDARTAHDAAR